MSELTFEKRWNETLSAEVIDLRAQLAQEREQTLGAYHRCIEIAKAERADLAKNAHIRNRPYERGLAAASVGIENKIKQELAARALTPELRAALETKEGAS